MSVGRKGVAPCGCPGTHIFANYVECDVKCEAYRTGKAPNAVPAPIVDDEATKPMCLACGSTDLSFWRYSTFTGHPLYFCNHCHGLVST